MEAPVNGVAPSPSVPANAAIDFVAAQGDIDDPYPEGVPRHFFLPAAGGPPIVFPAFTSLRPPRKFIWSIYKKNAMIQGFEWMNFAGVPERIQERVVDLTDGEYQRFWKEWFSAINPNAEATEAGPPGES